MEMFNEALPQIIEDAGWLAPILFILVHLIRPFLFLPVIVVCIAGGYLFGIVPGTIYSAIGLSLMSLFFYKIVNVFPSFRERVLMLKKRLFKDRLLTIGQVMILRMMPFVHFHMLSLYLMEMTKSFREYMRYSIAGVLLPALLYTSFGQALTEMPIYISITIIMILITLFTYLGNRGTVTYNWHSYFSTKKS